ncbi:hypothetical protein C8R46DRAFT_1025883 [Mycena filopes]|nr:hypothetical protein C8R46DRAFT_1025883 [Mycena filopes]
MSFRTVAGKMLQCCGYCFITEDKHPLKTCAGCKGEQYCSKSCQRLHWPTHKPRCQINTSHAAAIQNADIRASNAAETGGTPQNPYDISFIELEDRMAKWCRYYNQPLKSAAIQGLQLPLDLTRAKDYMLVMKIELCAGAVALKASQSFAILEVGVLPLADAMQRENFWPGIVKQMAHWQEDHAKAGNTGQVVVVVVQYPLGVHLLRFWVSENVHHIPLLQNWEAMLRQDIARRRRISKGACLCCSNDV